jgi:hypothetical protein
MNLKGEHTMPLDYLEKLNDEASVKELDRFREIISMFESKGFTTLREADDYLFQKINTIRRFTS